MFDGPGNTTLTDYVYGILVSIIIYNGVVLALVADTWSNATSRKKTRKTFYQYRYNFVVEVNDIYWNVIYKKIYKYWNKIYKHFGFGDPTEEKQKQKQVEKEIFLRELIEENSMELSELLFQHSESMSEMILQAIHIFFWYILGLFCFGLVWPPQIQRLCFSLCGDEDIFFQIRGCSLERASP